MPDKKINRTILFVDVSESTRLYELLGDAAAYREVREYLSVFGEVVAQSGGRVVKTIGDGALCVFPDADSAVLAACEMQARVHERQAKQNRKIAIRIGLHHGSVLLEGDDVYGDTVNTAARMAQLAASGQIITSGETIAVVSDQYRNSTRRLDALPVKGKHEEVTVYEVLWQASSDRTQMPGRSDAIATKLTLAQLRLIHGGREIIVADSVTMGRQASNGIALRDPMASRVHVVIERRKDKFVLIDQSSNGTFVRMKGGEEFRLRREEMILYGSGSITFGHPAHEDGAEIVGFRCESKGEVDEPPTITYGKT
jgi:class 3 adenylate cyclase